MTTRELYKKKFGFDFLDGWDKFLAFNLRPGDIVENIHTKRKSGVIRVDLNGDVIETQLGKPRGLPRGRMS